MKVHETEEREGGKEGGGRGRERERERERERARESVGGEGREKEFVVCDFKSIYCITSGTDVCGHLLSGWVVHPLV